MIRSYFLLAALWLAPSLNAAVTIDFGGPDLHTNSNTNAPHGSLVLLLANVGTSTTAGAGFGLLSAGNLNVGDLLNGSYQVLGRAGIDSSFGAAVATGSTGSIELTTAPFSNLSVGDQLAIAWVPSLTYSSGVVLAAGTSYGLFTIDNNSSWQVPASGLITLNVPAESMASLSAIPEPSTYAAIAGVTMLGFAAWRRRRARFGAQRDLASA